MEKKITIDEINAILQLVYQTNISAQAFDGLKKLFTDLPEIKGDELSKE